MAKLMQRRCALIVALGVISACVQIPEDDVNFLDKRVPIGMDVSLARDFITRRGFEQIEIRSFSLNYDPTSQSFIKSPLNEAEIAQGYIGFVELKGEPHGRLSCFGRGYTRFMVVGDRLICLTADEDDKITWRQAGWKGASL